MTDSVFLFFQTELQAHQREQRSIFFPFNVTHMVSFFTDITSRLRNLLQIRERMERVDSRIVIIFNLTLMTTLRAHQHVAANEMHRILRSFFRPEMYCVLPFTFIFAPTAGYCDIHPNSTAFILEF